MSHRADNALFAVCAVFSFLVFQNPAMAGTYQLYSNTNTQNIYNATATTGSIDATYYRDLVVSYETRFNGAFVGYGPAFFRHYCNGTLYATNKVATGNSFAANSDNLACELTPITLDFTGSGWFNPGPNQMRNIVVTGIKDPPVATAQSISVNKNSNSGSVALNVSDPQGAPMTRTVTVAPTNGVLSWSGLNFTYTPNSCFSGSDSFKYYVSENVRSQTSSTVTVSITVNHVNFPPSINTVSNFRIPWYAPYSLPLSGIAAGTCGGSTVTISATSGSPSVFPNPTVSYTSPATTGSLTFTPLRPAVQNGTSAVTLNISDGVNTRTLNFNTSVDWVSLMHK